MTDPIRNLLISLSSHMAYMQGQLEAGLVLYDPEHYYWYRESVLLRQKVADALADEPAVPDGREPASVTGQPSDEDLLGIACQSIEPYDKIRPGEYEAENNCAIEVYGSELVTFARAVLARWGNPAPQPPAEGEVAELVRLLGSMAAEAELADQVHDASVLDRAADLLRRLSPPQPVPVSERLPVGVEQALIKAECALSDIAEGEPEENEGDANALLQWAERRAATALSRIRPVMRLHGILTSEWPPLPAHALPVPGQEVAG